MKRFTVFMTALIILTALLFATGCRITAGNPYPYDDGSTDSNHTITVTDRPSFLMSLSKLLLMVGNSDFSEDQYEDYLGELQNREYPEPAQPPENMESEFTVNRTTYNSWPVYTLEPKDIETEYTVIYAHGGAFVKNLLSWHWAIAEQLSRGLHAKIVIPLYPLAPEYDHEYAYSFLDGVYDAVCDEEDNPILFSGDSAGGGISLVQAMKRVEKEQSLPIGLVLFSPWVDISMTNKDVESFEPNDPVFGVASLREIGLWWADGKDVKHPMLSPVNGNLEGLPPVIIFGGTSDLLHPDVRILAEKISNSEGRVYVFEYTGAYHVFMRSTFTQESKHVYLQIEQLRDYDW